MEGTELNLVLNHLRLAIRMGIILLPTSFIIGVIVGWALSKWELTHVGSVLGASIGGLAMAWLTWAYYQTRGLMHYSGFGKWKPDDPGETSATQPRSPR